MATSFRSLNSPLDSICGQCIRKLRHNVRSNGRDQSLLLRSRRYNSSIAVSPRTEFFRWNESLRALSKQKEQFSLGILRKQSTVTDASSINDGVQQISRRKIPSKTKESAQLNSLASKSQSSESPDAIIPPDASSQLTTISTTLPNRSLKRQLASFLALSKPRLTFLIVLTTTAAYSMYPVPAMLDPAAVSVPSLSPITLLFLTSGTFLTCASANAFNMLMEPEHDAKMSRTRNRPLVRKLLSGRAALLFAILSGTVGTAALYFGVNPTTAFLASSNIFLYAAIYTPLKRIHPINTWVGAIVGGIPPLMGWTAASGQCASESGDWHELLFGEASAGGWVLAAMLFFWQLPHFAALSWTIRHEYAAAGYKMLCSSRPRLDALFSLGCAALLPACTVQLYTQGVIDGWASLAMTPANIWIIWRAMQFRKLEGAKSSARNLFWASVWYIPIVLVLGMVGKKGFADRLMAWFRGEEVGDFEDELGGWAYEQESAPVQGQKLEMKS